LVVGRGMVAARAVVAADESRVRRVERRMVSLLLFCLVGSLVNGLVW
jgi:hypothetical protein